MQPQPCIIETKDQKRLVTGRIVRYVAEAMTLLRGLTDSQLAVALAQIKALGELEK